MNSVQLQRRSKEARSTDTRDRLLAAAREIVARDGIGGATSRRITAAAGANLASVTYHFGSKDELVAAALLEEVESLIEPALTTLEGDAAPAARLLEAVQLLVETFATQHDRVPLYFEAAATELRSGTSHIGEGLARVRTRLTDVIEGLQTEGTVPEWIEPAAMAALIAATAQGLVLQSALDPNGPGAQEQAGQLAGLLLEARAS